MEKANNDFEKIKEKFNNIKIKWVAMSGLYADIIEERHARLVLPLRDLHVNHVGTAYAGSMFMLAEMMQAAIIFCTYGTEKYIPIASKMEIEYLKPTKKDLVVDMRLTEEEAEEKIKPIEERGKGRMTLLIPITDIDGAEVARVTAVVYLMPFVRDLIK